MNPEPRRDTFDVASESPASVGPVVGTAGAAQEPKDVSIIELLATPERFRGQRVRVIGYATLEFEGSAVYLHKEDYLQAITRNALWLDVLRTEPPRLTGPGYAIVEGRYDPDGHGHMSLFSGALTQVDRLAPWHGREQPQQ